MNVNTQKIIHPQEIEAWYILPLIRKELACAMKKEGLDQKEIANLLSVTEGAISQYINNKRGNDFKIDKKMKEKFSESAKIITNNKTKIFDEVQLLLKELWDEGVVCTVHKAKSWCPDECKVCIE